MSVVDFDEHRSGPRHDHLVAGRTDGLTPLAVRVHDGRASTYVPTAAGVDVRPGVLDGALVMDLPLELLRGEVERPGATGVAIIRRTAG